MEQKGGLLESGRGEIALLTFPSQTVGKSSSGLAHRNPDFWPGESEDLCPSSSSPPLTHSGEFAHKISNAQPPEGDFPSHSHLLSLFPSLHLSSPPSHCPGSGPTGRSSRNPLPCCGASLHSAWHPPLEKPKPSACWGPWGGTNSLILDY